MCGAGPTLGRSTKRRHSSDPPHELDELVYSFLHGEWVDVLRVRSDSVAMAGRFLAESVIAGRPRACWSVDGTLAEVLDALTTLPPPSAAGAPRLLGGSAPFDLKPDVPRTRRCRERSGGSLMTGSAMP